MNNESENERKRAIPLKDAFALLTYEQREHMRLTHNTDPYSMLAPDQVERYWRDARLTTIFEGTSEIQRRTISDRILGRVA